MPYHFQEMHLFHEFLDIFIALITNSVHLTRIPNAKKSNLAKNTVEPRYFECPWIYPSPLRFPGYFEAPLLRPFFHFPWDFEIAGFGVRPLKQG